MTIKEQIDNILENIDDYDKYTLYSYLKLVCCEYNQLYKELKYKENQISSVSSNIVNSLSQFINEQDKVFALYKLDKSLFKEIE